MNILRWLDAGLNDIVFFSDVNAMTLFQARKERGMRLMPLH